ncbi:MAG TPA: YqiJ family protein [Burkholderiales bacterium]|nr:YqiJ family protein [Burkholderiales bacterium]
MSVFLAPESWPFLAATLVLLALTLVEGLALLVGFSASQWVDSFLPDSVHADAPDSVLGWLHVGKVPLLVLLIVFLASFAVIGFALNIVASGVFGLRLPALLSGPIALIAALPVVRGVGAAVAHIIPRDQSYAVSLDTLVGRVAAVVAGTARQGYPAQARVMTEHGQTVYVMVEPDTSETTFPPNESVLLVRRVSGTRFVAIKNPRPDLL